MKSACMSERESSPVTLSCRKLGDGPALRVEWYRCGSHLHKSETVLVKMALEIRSSNLLIWQRPRERQWPVQGHTVEFLMHRTVQVHEELGARQVMGIGLNQTFGLKESSLSVTRRLNQRGVSLGTSLSSTTKILENFDQITSSLWAWVFLFVKEFDQLVIAKTSSSPWMRAVVRVSCSQGLLYEGMKSMGLRRAHWANHSIAPPTQGSGEQLPQKNSGGEFLFAPKCAEFLHSPLGVYYRSSELHLCSPKDPHQQRTDSGWGPWQVISNCFGEWLNLGKKLSFLAPRDAC